MTSKAEPEPEHPDTTDDEPRAGSQASARGHGDQDENGVDLSSLRRNLRLTPAQRLARLQQAVASMPRVRQSA